MTPSLAEEIAAILGDGVKPDSRIVQRLVALVEREKAITRAAHEDFGDYLERQAL